MKRILLVLIALATNLTAEASTASLKDSVYTARLVENRAEYCTDVESNLKRGNRSLKFVNEQVISIAENSFVEKGYSLVDVDNLNKDALYQSYESLLYDPYIVLGGHKVYIRVIRESNYEKGIATAGHKIILRDKAYKKSMPVPQRSDGYKRASPFSELFRLLSDKSAALTLIAYNEKQIRVFRSNEELGWDLQCKVSIESKLLPELSGNSELMQSIAAFQNFGSLFVKQPGECFTYPLYHQEKREQRSKLAEKLLREPWSLYEVLSKQEKDKVISRHYRGLDRWSVNNLDDFDTYNQYRKSLIKLKNLLAGYYFKNFNISKVESEELASDAVDIATSAYLQAFEGDAIDVSSTDSYKLRKLILERGSIEEIRKFKEPVRKESLVQSHYPIPAEVENILSIAIDYPEALEHLLKLGYDPNYGNLFGKTPLMYAVQRNQVQAVELLLAYGANLNAVTRKPKIGCGFYRLGHTNVSVLHYAVRYASRDIIEVLLKNGADPYVFARRNNRVKKEDALIDAEYSPMQWLQLLVDDATVKWMKKEKQPEIFINNNLSIEDIEQIFQKYKRSKTSSAQVSTGN